MEKLCLLLVTACGRYGFEAATDQAADAGAANGDSSVIQRDLFDGCAAHYRFDELLWIGSAGEVRDSCGTNHGRAINASTVDVAIRGRAGAFDQGSCVIVPDAPTLHPTSELTMSAWLLPIGLDGAASLGVIAKRRDYQVDTEYTLSLWQGDHAYVDIDREDDRFATRRSFVNNQWSQVTVVFDGKLPAAERVRVYVDGALAEVAGEQVSVVTATTAPLHIGCLPLGQPAQSFVGAIDEVALWTRALSDDEVAMWYGASRQP